MTKTLGVLVVLSFVAATATAGGKQKKPAPEPPKQKQDEPVVEDEADAPPELPPHVEGPKLVDLGNSVEIDLPAGFVLLEQVEAHKMLEANGDDAEGVLAVVFQTATNWILVIEYDDAGYVDDGDANDLDAEALLSSYKEGTAAQNVKRKAKGVSELFVDGWRLRPQYVRAKHHLIWGLDAHSSDGKVVNACTRMLGRAGYLSVDVIDAPELIEQAKQQAEPALAAIRFKPGARYEDHTSSDKSSGLGLKALVLGGTGVAVVKAAKAGILVKLLLIFKKAFLFIFAAIAGFFKMLFGRKKKLAAEPTIDDSPPPG